MKVKLLKDARIVIKAGEIVEVSPEEYAHLTSLGFAVDAVKKTAEPKIEETPEEKPKKAIAKVKATTRKKK